MLLISKADSVPVEAVLLRKKGVGGEGKRKNPPSYARKLRKELLKGETRFEGTVARVGEAIQREGITETIRKPF